MDLATQGVEALRMMSVIREFEARLPAFSEAGLIRGSTHPSVGMEAVAVGVSMNLQPQDAIASNHRGHAHCIARGADLGKTLAEIFGRSDGYCRGHGGSMHLGVKELGILGTNGVVGAGIGLATGSALSAKLRGVNEVSVVYFGDGATNQGILAESLNLAAIWSLPVVFVCENNQYAQSTPLKSTVKEQRLTLRGEAYGVPSYDVDGMDVAAVYQLARDVVERARSGGGPSMILAECYRYLGHMAADTEIYRQKAEVESWKNRDPIATFAIRLREGGFLDDAKFTALQKDVTAAVDAAEAFAKAAAMPTADQAMQHVIAAE